VELIGPYFAACLLMMGAGVAKTLRPDDTARALASLTALGPRSARRVVRVGAGAEAALGAYALVDPRSYAPLGVAVSFAAFAVFVEFARRRGGPLASCGCFGSPDTPPTRLHVAIDLALSASAAQIAANAASSPLGAGAAHHGEGTGLVTNILIGQPLDGVPLVLASLVCAWLAYHAMSTLPRARVAGQTPDGRRS
jgi:hypothetical protein